MSENIRRRSKNDDDTDDDAWKLQEGHMCPACIASTAVMVAGAGSAGGILAVCIGKFRTFFQSESSRSVSENKGEMIWQQAKERETRNTGKGISR